MASATGRLKALATLGREAPRPPTTDLSSTQHTICRNLAHVRLSGLQNLYTCQFRSALFASHRPGAQSGGAATAIPTSTTPTPHHGRQETGLGGTTPSPAAPPAPLIHDSDLAAPAQIPHPRTPLHLPAYPPAPANRSITPTATTTITTPPHPPQPSNHADTRATNSTTSATPRAQTLPTPNNHSHTPRIPSPGATPPPPGPCPHKPIPAAITSVSAPPASTTSRPSAMIDVAAAAAAAKIERRAKNGRVGGAAGPRITITIKITMTGL